MTTVDTGLLLDIRVVGTPRPKGSMRHVGGGRLVEQLAGSPDWRAAIVTAAYEAIRCRCPQNCDALQPGFPYAGPVTVRITLWFAPPKKRQRHPATRATGDIDKHARQVLDALQDAGVIKDDAAVVELHVRKAYTSRAAPGALITVRAADESPQPPVETSGVRRAAGVQPEILP